MMIHVMKETLRVVRELISGDLPWSGGQRSDIYPDTYRVSRTWLVMEGGF